MGRIIIFTGKGGVGKTSVAAAHAVRSAGEKKKTLLVSTDMAHNLGDLFGREAGREIVKVTEYLDILELDPDWLMTHDFPDLKGALSRLMGDNRTREDDEDGQFLLPGFENLFSLLKIRDLYLNGSYERIMVDCAPTGETLSLLKLPELLTWYMEKFFPVGKFMVRVLSPVSRLKYKVSLPNSAAMDEVGELHSRLVLLQSLLQDPDVSTIRLVCVPERMVVEETKRNYMYMNLYGYRVDRVFINRVLPEDSGSEFMNHWRDIQKKYLDELESVFSSIPVTRIPWYPREVCGMEAVEQLGQDVLDIPGLFALAPAEERETYTRIAEGYKLSVPLPGADVKKIRVNKFHLDLDIILEHFHRRIPLPNTLRDAEICRVDYLEGILDISFRMPEKGADEEGTKKDNEDKARAAREAETAERIRARKANAEKVKARISGFRKAGKMNRRGEDPEGKAGDES